MAVIQYSLGYRQGAASSSPVGSFYLGDTAFDVPTAGALEGDLAYVKDTDTLFFFNGSGWIRLARLSEIPGAFDGGTIHNDLTILKTTGKFTLDEGVLAKGRVMAVGGNHMALTHNVDFSTAIGNWVRDDASKYGILVQLALSNLYIYIIDTANNIYQIVNIDANGNVYLKGGIAQYSRTIPDGVWQDVPYSSGNFGTSGGAWIVDPADIASYKYMLIGKTMWMNVTISQSSVINPGTLFVRIPGGYTPNGYYNGTIWSYDGVSAWVSGMMIAQSGYPWLSTQLAAYAPYQPSTNNTYLNFQMCFGVN